MLLFPNYLDDMASYLECETYWFNLFDDAVRAEGCLSDWINAGSRNLVFGNGTELDPVAAAAELGGIQPVMFKISPSTRKAVLLNHGFGARSGLEAKMDAHPWMKYDEINVLRFFAWPTETEVTLVKDLISIWAHRDTTFDDMRNLVDQLWRSGITTR